MASAQGLETYLNDHLAGAAAGSELASKISSEYAGTRFGPFLAELARDIDQDKVTLEELMELDRGEDQQAEAERDDHR
jgi:hypothetical protein